MKRNEQDQTVIIKDNVVIYGKLSGTTGTINVLGVKSAVEINQAIRQFTLKNGSKIGVFDRCVITAYIDKYGNKAIQ
ncbi:hypothetical protein [Solibacillus sp. FSL K6-1554]|uniref:hypothetical protein n=1 Tax=Solibacillus sp. FSL K6-1554 TaxID=2921472 RepID=UPI0030FB1963